MKCSSGFPLRFPTMQAWYNVGPPSDVNVGFDSPHEYYVYLRTINHSSWSYVHQLNAILGAPHCRWISFFSKFLTSSSPNSEESDGYISHHPFFVDISSSSNQLLDSNLQLHRLWAWRKTTQVRFQMIPVSSYPTQLQIYAYNYVRIYIWSYIYIYVWSYIYCIYIYYIYVYISTCFIMFQLSPSHTMDTPSKGICCTPSTCCGNLIPMAS